MRYFLGYLVQDKKLVDYYENITRDLSNRFNIENLSLRIPPHMTLKAPFETDNIGEFEDMVNQIASQEEKFRLVITEFGYFKETIFLKPTYDNRAQLVVDGISKNVSEFGYNKAVVSFPIKLHISLARHLKPELLNKIQSYVKTLRLPSFDIQFNNLTIFIHDEQYGWKVHNIYHFT